MTPELQQLGLNFLATFLVVTVDEVNLYGPLYVALSSLTLPLRQRRHVFHYQ